MTNTAQKQVFAASFGQVLTRAIYLTSKQIISATAPTTAGDLSLGLSLVTRELEKKAGQKMDPSLVVLSGSQQDLDTLSGKTQAQMVPEDQAITAAERFLTKSTGLPTAILDLGPSAFLDRYPAEEVARWLPYQVNLNDIENHLANKRLFPRVVPVTPHEYEIDLAVARQAVIKLGQKDGRDYLGLETTMNLVLTGGLLTSIPNTADLASVVLDSFYFKSGTNVYRDNAGDLVPLGAVLAADPSAEVDLAAGLKRVGSMIHLGGSHKMSLDFGYETKQRLTLDPGEIVTLPAGEDHSIEVSVGVGKSTHRYRLSGGVGGIYLDNRIRPLGVIASSKDSMARILTWRKQLSAEKLTSGESL
ncbi:MAG TPA: hypothetical protein VFK94_03805 [Patescibacteria group bacterium]|nr:hypothetical protein [Patescibacteria group bacterium]